MKPVIPKIIDKLISLINAFVISDIMIILRDQLNIVKNVKKFVKLVKMKGIYVPVVILKRVNI